MKIVLVGCGFLGSWTAEFLAKMLSTQDIFPDIVCIDNDRWNDRNAANQNVRKAMVGLPKADTIARLFQQYDLTAEAKIQYLTMENIHELGKVDLWIDCVDNIPTRQLLWAMGKVPGSATVHIGIAKNGNGVINWSSKDFDSFPFKPQDMAGRVLKDDDAEKEPPCEMYKYTFNGIRVAEAAVKAISFYLGKDPWRLAHFMTSNLITSLNIENTVEEIIGETELFEIPGVMTSWTTNGNSIEPKFDLTTTKENWFPINESLL